MFAGGLVVAGQARVNGELETHVGAVLASLVSMSVGTMVLLFGAALVGRGSWRRLSAARPWHFLGGFAGVAFVTVAALAVPLIGVAALTVAAVAGQTSGGLAVDRFGLPPGGARPITATRVVGAALAVGAVVLSATGHSGAHIQIGLFAGLVLIGAATALQQAANGHLRRVTDSPATAAAVNFSVGLIPIAVVALVMWLSGTLPDAAFPAQPWLYVGGFAGAFYILLAATFVRVIGVLQVMLATVSGQLTGAVILDVLVPTAGHHLTSRTAIAAGITFFAVAIAARGVRRPRRVP